MTDKVFCVICLDPEEGDVTHIFSTPEKAQAFAHGDSERLHVLYDYVIDCPERMEGLTQ